MSVRRAPELSSTCSKELGEKSCGMARRLSHSELWFCSCSNANTAIPPTVTSSSGFVSISSVRTWQTMPTQSWKTGLKKKVILGVWCVFIVLLRTCCHMQAQMAVVHVGMRTHTQTPGLNRAGQPNQGLQVKTVLYFVSLWFSFTTKAHIGECWNIAWRSKRGIKVLQTHTPGWVSPERLQTQCCWIGRRRPLQRRGGWLRLCSSWAGSGRRSPSSTGSTPAMDMIHMNSNYWSID